MHNKNASAPSVWAELSCTSHCTISRFIPRQMQQELDDGAWHIWHRRLNTDGKKKQRLWRVATSLDTVPKGGVPGSTVYLFHWHLSCQQWSRFAMATLSVRCLRKEYASTVPDDVSSLGPLILGCSVWRQCDAQNPQYLPSSLAFPAVCTMTRKFPTNQSKLIWEGKKKHFLHCCENYRGSVDPRDTETPENAWDSSGTLKRRRSERRSVEARLDQRSTDHLPARQFLWLAIWDMYTYISMTYTHTYTYAYTYTYTYTYTHTYIYIYIYI